MQERQNELIAIQAIATQFNTLDKQKKRKNQEQKRKLSSGIFVEGEQIVSEKV